MKGKAIVEQIRKDNIVRTDGLVTSSIRAHVLRRLSEEKKRLVAEHFALLEDEDFDDSDFDNGEDEEDFDDEEESDLTESNPKGIPEGLKPTDHSRQTRKADDKKVQRAAGKKAAKLKESFKVLKTARTYGDFGALRRAMSDEPIGYIPRVKDIPSPYASSPTDLVYDWDGKKVITREVKHKVFQVLEVPADVKIYKDEDDAMKAHLKA